MSPTPSSHIHSQARTHTHAYVHTFLEADIGKAGLGHTLKEKPCCQTTCSWLSQSQSMVCTHQAVKGIAERNSSQMGQLRHPKGKGLA